MQDRAEDVVATELMGDVWPATQPGEDAVLYGHANLEPRGAFAARSLQTFKMIYTVGRYGIDDTGSIRVVFRFMGDWGDLQTNEPIGYNYVTASTNTSSRLSLTYNKTGHQRPWFRSLTVRLYGGYLKEGEQITIVFGDTSGGSPGMKMQTFCESGFEFKVLADVCATGHYVPLKKTPYISIVPGEVHQWKAILPTLRRVGERFHLGIKPEDLWGNPTGLAQASFKLDANLPVNGLPKHIDFPLGEKAITLGDLSCNEVGTLRVRLMSEDDECIAEAGPLLVNDGELSGYWGDLHGQSGESIGVTTSKQYFEFARNKSFLDVTSHQANDFQVNNAFWKFLSPIQKTILEIVFE